MRRSLFATALLASLLLAPPAAAGVAVGVKAGTPGLGVELTVPLSGRLNGRFGLAGFDRGLDYSAAGIDYDGDLELLAASALFDLHPGGGPFRLSAGLIANDHRLTGRAPLAQLFREELIELGLSPSLDLGVLRGSAEVEPLAPYVGLGWGNAVGDGGALKFSIDLGVAFHGEPDIRLTADTPLPLGQIPGGRRLLDAVLEREQRELEAEAEDLQWFPVVAVGVSYRF